LRWGYEQLKFELAAEKDRRWAMKETHRTSFGSRYGEAVTK